MDASVESLVYSSQRALATPRGCEELVHRPVCVTGCSLAIVVCNLHSDFLLLREHLFSMVSTYLRTTMDLTASQQHHTRRLYSQALMHIRAEAGAGAG